MVREQSQELETEEVSRIRARGWGFGDGTDVLGISGVGVESHV